MHTNVVLERMVLELQRVSCISPEEAPPYRKMILASRLFGRRVSTWHELQEAVTTFVARAGEKVRRQGLACASGGGESLRADKIAAQTG